MSNTVHYNENKQTGADKYIMLVFQSIYRSSKSIIGKLLAVPLVISEMEHFNMMESELYSKLVGENGDLENSGLTTGETSFRY